MAQSETPMPAMPRSAVWLSCLLGVALIYGSTMLAGLDKAREGADDFLAFYAGARLAGSPAMFDSGRIRQTQLDAAGVVAPNLVSIRVPAFSLLLWPLAQLPYLAAHTVWYGLRAAAIAGFILLWPWNARSWGALICSWSLPLAAGIANGQDAPFLLLLLALWQRLERADRPVWAGLALSLCAFKFHLFLLLPLALIRHRRWAVARGVALGALGLYILSAAAAGWDWPARYARVLANPVIHPCARIMPNLHGLLTGVGSTDFEIALSVLVALAAAAVVWRSGYLEGIAAALAGGLLISYHAYVADAVILIPAVLIVAGSARGRALVYAAVLLASPVPWLLILTRAAGCVGN
jgi:hypothetical protein